MKLLRLSFLYFRSKPLHVALSMLLLMLGLSLMVSLLSINEQLQSRLNANAAGIGMVVSAKGSPLQAILCSVFQVEFPTGNIELAEARAVAKHPLVKEAIPMAIGDSYKGYRLVGTNHAYPAHYEATLQEGRLWTQVMEVTLGYQVAKKLSLGIGDQLISDHGFAEGLEAHDEHAFTVVGILKPTYTVLDDLILTGVESFWVSHDQIHLPHEAPSVTEGLPTADSLQITSLLIKFSSPLGAVQLPRLINTNTNMMAASPAYESARLFERLGIGVDILQAFALLVLVVAALSIFLSLFNALKERQYDLAMMRAMGASRGKVFWLVILESMWITVFGAGLGLLLGHTLVEAIALTNEAAERLGLSGTYWLGETELLLAGLSIVLGIISSLYPAWRAYRMDISDTLAAK
ncbi:MAG: FtsX-like permease family protein [Bacteroidota bacterium]